MDVNRLLVLKAFYLGHAIAEAPTSRAPALGMLNAAISQLKGKQARSEQIRLAFYYMLRAEVLRHDADPLPDRSQAKKICDSIGSSLYELFMAVQDATQSKKKLYGINTLVIADEGVKKTHYEVVGSGYDAWVVSYDIAMHTLGISRDDISVSEQHFLKQITLKDMLNKHGVVFSP